MDARSRRLHHTLAGITLALGLHIVAVVWVSHLSMGVAQFYLPKQIQLILPGHNDEIKGV